MKSDLIIELYCFDYWNSQWKMDREPQRRKYLLFMNTPETVKFCQSSTEALSIDFRCQGVNCCSYLWKAFIDKCYISMKIFRVNINLSRNLTTFPCLIQCSIWGRYYTKGGFFISGNLSIPQRRQIQCERRILPSPLIFHFALLGIGHYSVSALFHADKSKLSENGPLELLRVSQRSP